MIYQSRIKADLNLSLIGFLQNILPGERINHSLRSRDPNQVMSPVIRNAAGMRLKSQIHYPQQLSLHVHQKQHTVIFPGFAVGRDRKYGSRFGKSLHHEVSTVLREISAVKSRKRDTALEIFRQIAVLGP